MERFSETVEIQTFFAITYQILHINPLIKMRIKDGFCLKSMDQWALQVTKRSSSYGLERNESSAVMLARWRVGCAGESLIQTLSLSVQNFQIPKTWSLELTTTWRLLKGEGKIPWNWVPKGLWLMKSPLFSVFKQYETKVKSRSLVKPFKSLKRVARDDWGLFNY